MGRITILGGAVNQVLECSVTQGLPTYPEVWPSILPSAIQVTGFTSGSGFVAPGYIDGDIVTALGGGSAIAVGNGYGGSLIGNSILCSFDVHQVGVRSTYDVGKYIAQNGIDGCAAGLFGLGSSGDVAEGNAIYNATVRVEFDPQSNTVGSNACL